MKERIMQPDTCVFILYQSVALLLPLRAPGSTAHVLYILTDLLFKPV